MSPQAVDWAVGALDVIDAEVCADAALETVNNQNWIAKARRMLEMK